MDNSVSLGEYARQVIEQQFQHIIKQEEGVLEDADPEFLHQMRVGSRRLSTALEIFGQVVQLPKPARQKAVAGLAKSLGKLRDLDVQLITLKEEYSPRLKGNEQRSVNRLFEHLEDKRSHALLAVKRILSEEKYLNLKSEYTQWLAQPNYTPLAEINLELILPDLLSPLLSKLLLHPAWLIPVDDPSPSAALTLHALRKTCKSVRYQAEFFTNFYGADFQEWISQLKSLQDALGKVQDTHVFRKKMTTQFNDRQEFLELDSIIQEDCETALAGWDKIRHQYLDSDFRHGLRLMLITPTSQTL
jgi:CHAD domain-containing protein